MKTTIILICLLIFGAFFLTLSGAMFGQIDCGSNHSPLLMAITGIIGAMCLVIMLMIAVNATPLNMNRGIDTNDWTER
jgi:formate hydrogenlyase subunit 4